MTAIVRLLRAHRQWTYTVLGSAGAVGLLDPVNDRVRAVAIVLAAAAFGALLATEPRAEGWV